MKLTKAVLNAGDTVVATARNPKTIDNAFGKQDRLLTLRMDATGEQQAKESVDTAMKKFGQIHGTIVIPVLNVNRAKGTL
jgi:short-subunit dehydrogenase involved in D-alanine esterification of teichoic acids